MQRFKMIGKDINSNFNNYRNWDTVTSPDLTGELYSGLKSGKNKLEFITANLVLDDSLLIDYLLPKPLEWQSLSNLLPESLYGSQLVILDDGYDGYVYMFGGHDAYTILKSPLSNPDKFEIDGYLPTVLGGSSFAMFDGYMYLFGGKDGYTGTSSVFVASENEPNNWAEFPGVLPDIVYNSHVYVDDGYVYLFGGINSSGVTNKIYYTDRYNPLSGWLQLGTLPYEVAGGNLIISNSNLYLLGGIDKNFGQLNTIVKANLLDLFTWYSHSTTLPKKSAFMQSCRIGNKFYLFGGENTSQDVIVSNEDITSLTLTSNCLPTPVVNSQLAIIDDRIYLFGGNGSTIINVCKQDLNFQPLDLDYQNYGIIPKTILPLFSDPIIEWIILGFPSWITNYL